MKQISYKEERMKKIVELKNVSKVYKEENIGFIFQFYNILPTLTVLENVDNYQEQILKVIK